MFWQILQLLQRLSLLFRLHLSYGEEYGLTFYALPDDFIAAELIMPAETAAEKSGESSAQ